MGRVAVVVRGGIQGIGGGASRMVPGMCLRDVAAALLILALHAQQGPGMLWSIFHDAFSGTAAAGGAAGIAFSTVIQTGIKRAAFSNDAGIGTAPLAHASERTPERGRVCLVAHSVAHLA